MEFKAKIIKLGHGRAIYLPSNVYTDKKAGDIIDVYTDNVYTDKQENVIASQKKSKVITSKKKKEHNPFDVCPKHKVFYKTCGC